MRTGAAGRHLRYPRMAYVAGPDGAVYRTRTASLDEPELDKVADDLRQFLELLEHSLTRFIAAGETGNL